MDCDNVKHLSYARQIMPRLDVIVWGFSSKDLSKFPKGSPIEDGKLSSSPFLFNWPEENIRGPKEYNKKPEVNVRVYKFSGKIDVGYSGSPVCYSVDNVIVGLLTAKDNSYGYVIPIQTLLEKFEDEKQISKPAQTVDMEDYINKGNESFDKGDYDRAIKNYDEVLNNRNYVIALGNKGVALDVMGRHEEAIEWYDKVLAIDPNDVKALNNKGAALDLLKRHKKAIKWLDKALAIDPHYVIALGNKGLALGKLGQHKKAIKWLDKALAIDPNNIKALNNKGVALDYLERHEEAIEWYDKVLAIDPNNDHTLNNKKESLARLRKEK
jgi:tetratricopeptide (TPR) repeat protein